MTCLDCQNGDYWWTNATYGMCANCTRNTYFDATANTCIACPGGDRYNRTGVRTGSCLNSTGDNGTAYDFWNYHQFGANYDGWKNCENNT
jgi:hypothetical protein